LPIDKTQTPYVVDVSGELADEEPPPTDAPDTTDTVIERLTRLTAEVDRLTADNARLQARVDELREDRDAWKQAHYMALANVQQLTEKAGERPRRIRWPWQRD